MRLHSFPVKERKRSCARSCAGNTCSDVMQKTKESDRLYSKVKYKESACLLSQSQTRLLHPPG